MEGQRSRKGIFVGLVLASGVLLLSAPLRAADCQDQPQGGKQLKPTRQPVSKPRIEVVRQQPARPGQHPKAPASAPAAVKKSSGCGSKGKGGIPQPAPEGPHPKWACDAVTRTVDPVWKGERIKVTYKISNEGQADLEIKAKGG